MVDEGDRPAGGRKLRRTDGDIVSVNRFGWPMRRKSGKGSCSTGSVLVRPDANVVSNCTSPPRPRASFEVGLSPIIEDMQSFPSFGDVNSSFDTFSMLGGNLNQNTMNGGYEEQEYQDSRNFDHMNLSGSFVLQSTSCRDMGVRDPVGNEELVPALILTFPTPEPPKSPIFAPQSPFTVHKFVAATGPGTSTSAGLDQRTSSLAVPALPRCTHCGFGFGLDFHDLEAPLSSNPCRLCEPQWLACKMWYHARGDSLREPCAVRPAESNASSRAIVGKLGLPIGSHRGLGLEGVDELGQLDEKRPDSHLSASGEGYSRFSNVIIKDRTRTTRRTVATVWKKVSRLFGTQERGANRYSSRLHVDNPRAEPERRRNGMDFHWIGSSALVSVAT
ncbi:hypothetical protein C8F04DRAFT_493279 [Mycena alexandri]|uniref:Uncharacterized protein n=1 Tax=Mycena alexandri TaxID=1745969 RepID=A0AAD6RXT0_9AGAR|nr:hypothetical protein C8F04DRAFT_493279 [Mycena alexandri]